MTAITVVRKQGVVAIAADTMSKAASFKGTASYIVNTEKIWQVGENYLAIAGPTSAKLALQHYFSKHSETPQLRTVASIYSSWLSLHEALRDSYYLNAPEDDTDDAFESAHMDVLIANAYGIFGVSRHRAVQEFSKFYAYGRGDEYATGAMYIAYSDPNKSAEDIARLGVETAAEFSDSVGLPVVSHSVKLESA